MKLPELKEILEAGWQGGGTSVASTPLPSKSSSEYDKAYKQAVDMIKTGELSAYDAAEMLGKMKGITNTYWLRQKIRKDALGIVRKPTKVGGVRM